MMKDKSQARKISELIELTKRYFAGRAVENPRLDAEMLLCHILGKDRVYLYVHFDQPLEEAEINAYRKLVRRRAGGEPVAYITGRKNFMGMEFAVSPDVLIPRPETEFLAEAAIKYCRGKKARFLDIGTGSGALALSILQNCPDACAVGLDISAAALEMAKMNAEKFSLAGRIEFINSDVRNFFDQAGGKKFDLIVSNPPYIPGGEISALALEVQKEPPLALDGGPDGLYFYRLILGRGKTLLAPGGSVFLEIGSTQAAAVSDIALQAGFKDCVVLKDYAGLDRTALISGGGL
ncbi:MAG: peptide chain release factor N(5)-glutamine methyltransferase [Acidaminococcales bacterium]|jgi:release factor glutamine methyltransferase|nr:peptide chain release factor N(5)-glutamine methyltransferase [Acidaminococcales bacterium]